MSRCLTVIDVTEWACLWSGPDVEGDESRDPTTLLMEGHSVTIADLAQHADNEPFELDYVSADGTAADTEVSKRGGFSDLPLDKWIDLASKPG